MCLELKSEFLNISYPFISDTYYIYIIIHSRKRKRERFSIRQRLKSSEQFEHQVWSFISSRIQKRRPPLHPKFGFVRPWFSEPCSPTAAFDLPILAKITTPLSGHSSSKGKASFPSTAPLVLFFSDNGHSSHNGHLQTEVLLRSQCQWECFHSLQTSLSSLFCSFHKLNHNVFREEKKKLWNVL